ncbi:peptidylprolyl isomerase [Aquimarina sp. W85]|uniref:peptidylprolyl isomerase n=1 Tax=Aquimarina rhodophyticola TaxID=3342246 RepID=UPI0036716D41
MSLTRIILKFSLMVWVFIISSCEDTQSNKNKKTQSTNDSIKKVKSQLGQKKVLTHDTLTQSIDTKTTIKDSGTKLTNQNVIEFMTTYGVKNPETIVKITTRYGSFIIELYKKTPIHRANFIYLVKEGYFDETFFYRAAKNFVIQGGNSDRKEMAQKRFEIGEYTLPQEPIAGLKHERGAVALSKQWVDNPSNRATPYEFFVVVSKKGAHHLDGEHTIFGKVIKGMNVVDKISNVPVDQSEWPKENIFITAKVIK